MTDLPTVVIMLMTYKRTEYALRTIEAARELLSYDGELLWYVADAGSPIEDLKILGDAIPDEIFFGRHTMIESNTLTPGQNWNKGIKRIFEKHTIYFRLEDDFMLHAPLDITKWVRLLDYNDKVGMIRLGLMTVGTQIAVKGQVVPSDVGHDRDIYLHVLKSAQYCFSGHPSLVHKRFHEAYDYFPEDRDPGQCEVDFDGVIRTREGPEIWIPFDMGRYGTWGAFSHIGNERSY